MRKNVTFQLAWQSLKSNYRITLPFLLAGIASCALMYAINSLSRNPGITCSSLTALELGAWVIAVLCIIFFLYLNQTQIRSRRAETGLYTALGLEKKHLLAVVFYQVLAEFAGSLLIGIPCGIIFDKLMFLLFQNITGMDLQLGFSISLDAVLQTVYVTAVCFALIYVLDCIDLFSRKTAELLKGSQTGQKPVKNRWILALLSLLLLGTGYALALSIKDPVEAINWFFIAVLLVIAGTYLFFLFFAGVFVSLLQKNKAYYYKPNHFISVALMRHRITQNAMSLATLCVLSTMILVATSSCVSMIAGAQAQIEKQFPRNTVTSVTTFRGLSTAQSAQTDIALLKQSADDLGLKQEDPLSFYGIRSYTLQTPGYENSEAKIYEEIFTMPLSSYNAVAQEKLSLDSNQQAVYNLPVTGNDIELSQFLPAINAVDFYGLSSLRVVSDAAFEQLIENWQDLGDLAALTSVYAFDTAGYDSYSEEELTDIRTLLTDNVAYPLRDMQPESTTLVQSDFQSLALKTALSLYASVLFIGVFISIALAVFMILLMYYKQISEAMEDRSRFEILQKAGLEKKSVRKIISDQVLLLFFLPLFMAGMHLLFAFPMIRRILALMSSTDPSLFFMVTAAVFVLFVILYILLYKLTQQAYYNLACMDAKEAV